MSDEEGEESGAAARTAPPKLWTGLFAKASAAAKAPAAAGAQPTADGASAANASGAVLPTTGLTKVSTSSIAEAIQAYQVSSAEKLVFLEPRGLVNTGNMCYMNSVSCTS